MAVYPNEQRAHCRLVSLRGNQRKTDPQRHNMLHRALQTSLEITKRRDPEVKKRSNGLNQINRL